MKRHSFLEFFAGGGMAREGLGQGWHCLFANDFDAAKAASYAARWGKHNRRPPELRVADVGALTVADLPNAQADLAWASFPCQDLSVAGALAGLSGERSSSFLPFWMLIQKLGEAGRGPRVIVLENVCGLLTSNDGQDFADICRMLERGGYRFGALVMDAADFLPQSRPRLFIVAVQREMQVASASRPSQHWHPTRLLDAHAKLRPDLRREWLWLTPPVPAKRNSTLADMIEDQPSSVAWHTAEQTRQLLAMMNPLNLAKVEALRDKPGRAVGGVYKRTRVENGRKVQRAEVRFDDVAGCLRTPGGGSSRQTLVVIEDGHVLSRLISTRETARLMGLPDEYPLPPRYNDAYHLTGDGVAVPVVRHIAEWIVEPILDGQTSVSAA